MWAARMRFIAEAAVSACASWSRCDDCASAGPTQHLEGGLTRTHLIQEEHPGVGDESDADVGALHGDGWWWGVGQD